VCGRPSWREGANASPPIEGNAAEAILASWAGRPEDTLARVAGDFALALVDASGGYGLLATDRAGIRALYLAREGEALVFGSHLDLVLHALDRRPGLNLQALYDYCYFHVVPGPETIYREVTRLLPGQAAAYRDRRLAVTRYWQASYQESPEIEGPAAEAQLRELFLEGVRSRVDGAAVGAFLSGGTDSSTVCGMLARVRSPARTYSIGFDAEGYDEMEYARIASRHFGTEHHEYYVTPADVVRAIPLVAAACDQPFANASVVPAYYCARMAREDGVEVLLAGDGGDELFGGNQRYAKQLLFERYLRVPRVLRAGLVEPLLFGVPLAERVGPLRKLRSYVSQARVPLPRRLETYNLLDRLGAERVFPPEVLREVDTSRPVALLEETYHGAEAASVVNRMLAVDMRFTLADSDLPKVNAACALAGVEVRYPLLDDRVIEFAGRLRSDLKVRGQQLRYFFKQALRDVLPPEILAKRKHGFGLPFGVWLQADAGLRAVARESLERLGARGLVRAELIQDLLRERSGPEGAYLGVMVWTLVMLEQWLHARRL
jgi:asparagine synthase (glutamine-hydrolysing)